MRAADYFWAALILSLPLAALQVQTGVLAGLRSFREIARIRIAGGILGAILLVAASLARSAALAIVAAVLTAGLAAWATKRRIRLQLDLPPDASPASAPDAERSEAQTLGARNLLLPAIATGLLSTPVLWLCQNIASGQSGGLDAFAVLTVLTMWTQAILVIPANVGQPLLPEIMRALALPNARARSLRVYLSGLGLTALGVIPACAVLLIAAPWILRFYGPAFQTHAPAFELLICAASVQAMSTPAIIAVQAMGRLWLHFAVNLAWACLLVAATVFLRADGIIGYAWACLFAFLIHGIFISGFAVFRMRSP